VVFLVVLRPVGHVCGFLIVLVAIERGGTNLHSWTRACAWILSSFTRGKSFIVFQVSHHFGGYGSKGVRTAHCAHGDTMFSGYLPTAYIKLF